MFAIDLFGSEIAMDDLIARTDKCLQEVAIVLPLEKKAPEARAAFSAMMQQREIGKESAGFRRDAEAMVGGVSVIIIAAFAAQVRKTKGAKLMAATIEAQLGVNALNALVEHAIPVFLACGPCENLLAFAVELLTICHSDPVGQITILTTRIKVIERGCDVNAQCTSSGDVDVAARSDEDRVAEVDMKCRDLRLLVDVVGDDEATGDFNFESTAVFKSVAENIYTKVSDIAS